MPASSPKSSRSSSRLVKASSVSARSLYSSMSRLTKVGGVVLAALRMSRKAALVRQSVSAYDHRLSCAQTDDTLTDT